MSRPPLSKSRAATLLAALLVGCAPPPPVVIGPAVDPEQLALALEDRTTLQEPVRIVFGWQLNEAGMRASGRGVARIEPPYRARLDLFMGNGETVISAALVDRELILPPGAPDDILPPPDLMWGVLGVFRPELGIELMGAQRLADDGHQLRYRYADGSELLYRVAEGRVRGLELLEEGHVVQRVEVRVEGVDPYPLQATYRNLAAFRELRLTRESVERVESYPPDIWDPTPMRNGR